MHHRRRLGRRVRIATLALSALLSATGRAPIASGAADDPVPAKPQVTPIEKRELPKDTSTKRATLEIAEYTDTDHVTVFTPSVGMSIENITAGASIRGNYLVDVVSAASVDIVSTASRRWIETRHAGTLSGEYKPHDFGVAVGGSVSSEPDYLSYSLGATMTHDFDVKNTTLLLGYAYGHDTIGRHETSFAVFSRELTRATYNAGITQVIDRSTVLGVGMDLIIENGDQSKPYRYIPMFSPKVAASAPEGASIDWVTANRLPERPLDQLPLSRHRFAVTGRLSHRFDGSTVRLSERLYDDTWGLTASTTDVRWIFDVHRRFAFWPHARYHLQSPVSFWKRAYTSNNASPGWDLPEFRTGDRELGPLWTATGGAGLKFFIGSDAEPRPWAISVIGDVSYTAYTDDLYLTSRTAFLGAMALEGEL
jgi:hypothetical protein